MVLAGRSAGRADGEGSRLCDGLRRDLLRIRNRLPRPARATADLRHAAVGDPADWVSAVYAKKTDSGGHPLDISPFGPVRPWYEAGRAWVRNPSVLQLQRLYPEPPLVLFISDNESSKVTPDDLHASYSVDASPKTIARRRAIGDAWIARYKAMIDGMRDGLDGCRLALACTLHRLRRIRHIGDGTMGRLGRVLALRPGPHGAVALRLGWRQRFLLRP